MRLVIFGVVLLIFVVIFFLVRRENYHNPWFVPECVLRCGNNYGNCYLGCSATQCYEECKAKKHKAPNEVGEFNYPNVCKTICDWDFAYRVVP